MIDPKKQQELDQGQALMMEYFPPMWRKLFEKCQEEGFEPAQALLLVQTYILSQCPFGVNGTK